MKNLKRIISLALTAAMLFSIALPPVQAADYNYSVHTLSPGKQVTTRETGYVSGVYTKHVYQFKLASDGYITLDVATRGDASCTASISKKKVCSSDNILLDRYVARGDKETFKIALTKGTYYLYCNYSAKIKYTFKKQSIEENYSALKATKLAANKNTVIMSAGEKRYGHWYKITLKSKKKLSFVYNNMTYRSHDIYIYDAAQKYMTSCYCTGENGTQKTSNPLDKGTYYLYVPMNSELRYSDMFSFKWK